MLGVVHSGVGTWLSELGPSRVKAFLLGVISHAGLDFLGHEEPLGEDNKPRLGILVLDAALTITALTWLGLRRGWLSPSFMAALASVLPDVEHVIWLGHGPHIQVFPSHRFYSTLHSRTGFTVDLKTQFTLGVLVWVSFALTEGRSRSREPLRQRDQ